MLGQKFILQDYEQVSKGWIRIVRAKSLIEPKKSDTLLSAPLSFDFGGLAPFDHQIHVPMIDSGDEEVSKHIETPPDQLVSSFPGFVEPDSPPASPRFKRKVYKGSKKSSGSDSSSKNNGSDASQRLDELEEVPQIVESQQVFFTQQEEVLDVPSPVPEATEKPLEKPESPEIGPEKRKLDVQAPTPEPKRSRRKKPVIPEKPVVNEVSSEIDPKPVQNSTLLEIFALLEGKKDVKKLEEILKTPPTLKYTSHKDEEDQEDSSQEDDPAEKLEMELNDKALRWLTFARKQSWEYKQNFK